MTSFERKQINMLREMYLEWKLEIRICANQNFTKDLYHDYATCMDFYCESYGYDRSKRCEDLERKWDSMFRKDNR